MALKFLALLALLAIVCGTKASDPELVTDFFVPLGKSAANFTANDFTFIGLRMGAKPVANAKFAASKVNSENFVSLSGLGVSVALLTFLPGGINPPHTHPRGTELLYVLEGTLNVGLVDSTNKFYNQTLWTGDLFVFPKGLVHFQINMSNKITIAYSAFSSSSPGTVSLPATLFGSGISSEVLTTAFKVESHVVTELEDPFTK